MCDHDYESAYCERCGKYTGMVCNACGDCYDGGDHMAAQFDIWCDCTIEELNDFHYDARTDSEGEVKQL
jgi:hypothetical protein